MMPMKKIRHWAINFLLVIASILGTVAAVEIVLRFTHYRYYFIKSPLNWLCPDDSAGYDICENVAPIRIEGAEYFYSIWSNELGCFDLPYRGEKNYILLVGDSFTFGHVPFKTKLGTLLEKYLGYRVLKCGVGGYGTLQAYYKIKKIIKKTNMAPQMIIVGYWMGDDLSNDFENFQEGITLDDDASSKNEEWKYSIYQKSQSLQRNIRTWARDHLALYHIFNKSVVVRRLAQRVGFIDILVDNSEFASVLEYPWLTQAWELHLKNVMHIKELADTYNARLLFVLIPTNTQVYDFLRPSGKFDFNRPNRILGEFFEKNGIEYLDLTPLLRRFANQKQRLRWDNQDDLFWEHDIHLNVKGNKLAALFIAQHILDKKLLEIKEDPQKKEMIVNKLNILAVRQ